MLLITYGTPLLEAKLELTILGRFKFDFIEKAVAAHPIDRDLIQTEANENLSAIIYKRKIFLTESVL